ncbi:hypothetical protein KO500_04060 [Cellulophaga baltica]|uniref:hypothetical protein n=1 Tax=Cellulophaga TaxID=104264 RepID=UPI001C07E971|nr:MULTISPECIES: hypothetical protein [Cellulophaga]MBU2995589.1 hypothetical protein [Cellulophaga baltica]MDO6766983.1 hypothetical protein [Cellulophaga sp. 1_MG-2023]
MKKLIIASVFAFVGLTAFAQNVEIASVDNRNHVVTVKKDKFTKIHKDKLPRPVVNAVAKNFPTAKIDEAFVNDKKHYKLKLSLRDGTTGTFYADKNGNWIDQ